MASRFNVQGSRCAVGSVRGFEVHGPRLNLTSPSVVISARGEERVASGHPWIYRGDVGRRHARRRATSWSCAARAGGRSARRFYSDRSQIALRMLT